MLTVGTEALASINLSNNKCFFACIDQRWIHVQVFKMFTISLLLGQASRPRVSI